MFFDTASGKGSVSARCCCCCLCERVCVCVCGPIFFLVPVLFATQTNPQLTLHFFKSHLCCCFVVFLAVVVDVAFSRFFQPLRKMIKNVSLYRVQGCICERSFYLRVRALRTYRFAPKTRFVLQIYLTVEALYGYV